LNIVRASEIVGGEKQSGGKGKKQAHKKSLVEKKAGNDYPMSRIENNNNKERREIWEKSTRSPETEKKRAKTGGRGRTRQVPFLRPDSVVA